MLHVVQTQTRLKEVEQGGFKVELLAEGNLFRVNVSDADGGFPRTRVFTEYAEASALFDSYLEGN